MGRIPIANEIGNRRFTFSNDIGFMHRKQLRGVETQSLNSQLQKVNHVPQQRLLQMVTALNRGLKALRKANWTPASYRDLGVVVPRMQMFKGTGLHREIT